MHTSEPVLSHEREHARQYRAWLEAHVAPLAARFDRDDEIPRAFLSATAAAGFLCPTVAGPERLAVDNHSLGAICEEVGRLSSALLSILTVQTMVAEALKRWGSATQQQRWLGRLASGDCIAAFALTEPEVGSDAKSVQTTARLCGHEYVLNGRKKWISAGAIADVFLVVARAESGPVTLLVPRELLSVEPIHGMLGFRGAMLAELSLDNARVPVDAVVGRAGFGISHVVATALDVGRYCIAWGCAGLASACLEASLAYTRVREQFQRPLIEHQLVARKVSNMIVGVRSAHLMCRSAAEQRAAGRAEAIATTAMAKYYASRVACDAADDAVQLHGANGCSAEYPVERYLRDARIMQIIEGSSQIQQVLIAELAGRGAGLRAVYA